MNTTGLIIGWLVTGLTAIGAFTTAIGTRRRVTADIESVSVETMETVVKRLRLELQMVVAENEVHEARLLELEHERESLRMLVVRLEGRISKLELWIRRNTSTDPADINGHPV